MLDAIREELKRPATAVAVGIAVIFAVIAFGVSLYFYYKGIRVGQVSYYAEQVQVFDRKRVTSPGSVTAFPLTVLDAHGQPIEDNVYAASVTIWNSGNAEIRKDDVRIPFRITLQGNPRLIDITPTFFTRDNVDRFSLGGENFISWEHFDPGEGIKVRVIYADIAIREISVSGYAVGTKSIVDYQHYPKDFSAKYGMIISISNVVLLSLLAIFLVVRLYMAQAGTRRYVVAEVLASKYVFLLLMFLPIGVIVTWILDISLTKRTIPPF